jgi:hypothetical protein
LCVKIAEFAVRDGSAQKKNVRPSGIGWTWTVPQARVRGRKLRWG